MTFLMLELLLVGHFLKLCSNDLGKICLITYHFFGLGSTCTPILDGSTVLAKMMALTCIEILVWSNMLLTDHAMHFSPAHLLRLLGMWESIDSIMHFPSTPLDLIALGSFLSSSALFSMFLRTRRRALELMGVVFSITLYLVSHLARHMHNR